MSETFLIMKALATGFVLGCATLCHGDVISINFVGTAGANGTLASQDLAGVTAARALEQGFT